MKILVETPMMQANKDSELPFKNLAKINFHIVGHVSLIRVPLFKLVEKFQSVPWKFHYLFFFWIINY